MSRGEVKIGWVCQPVSQEYAKDLAELVQALSQDFEARLQEQFPGFRWQSEVRVRSLKALVPQGLDPLDLLATACHEKLLRGWDFAFVVTDGELLARKRPFVLGLPSSALESAVLTSARFSESGVRSEDLRRRLLVTARYLFGHLLGLNPHEPGAMRRPLESGAAVVEDYDELDQTSIGLRLEEVADARLEEEGQTSRFWYPLKTLAANPRGILLDVMGYQPWLQPFRLGSLTAAALISMIFLFFGAEAWELGFKTHFGVLLAATFAAIGSATAFLYQGQNLQDFIRESRMSEQLARTQVVLILTLLFGMISLWSILFVASLVVTFALPASVIEAWTSMELTWSTASRFSCFAATLGTLAGALGGNLEDERSFKAKFLIDEET